MVGMGSLLWSRPQVSMESLVTSTMVMPLLSQWAHLPWEVGIVVHRIQSWTNLMPYPPPVCTRWHSASQAAAGSCQLSFSLISLYLASMVCGIFSSKVVSTSVDGGM